jgi:CRP-like cAMP-binding protein
MTETIVLDGETDQKIKILNDRFQPKIKLFNRREIVVTPSSDNNMMGLIISGTAYLATINLDYQQRIIDYYEANDIFFNRIMSDLGGNSHYIFAKTKCTVAFLDYRELLKDNSETFAKLQEHLLVDSRKRLLEHIDTLSQRSLRNKLISFFEYYRKRKDSTSFVLPMTLSELADYLAVDRSAMTREIGKMNDEKIIMSIGRKIVLLK